MTDALDLARERLAATALSSWCEDDLNDLARLLRKLADAAAPDTVAAGAPQVRRSVPLS